MNIKMKSKQRRRVAVVTAFALMIATPFSANAGNKKLMSVSAAERVAERAIVESVIGLKVRSKESVNEMMADSVVIDAKTSAAISGIEFKDRVYDRDKDIAMVTAVLRLGEVENIIGKRIDYGDREITRVGFGTSTPASAGALKALRAAELDAYRKLARKVVGFKLKSETSVEDFVLKSDRIRTKLLAAIYGAEMTNYRWDEDGNAYITMTMKIGDVEDVLGQRVKYKGKVFEVIGRGAQVDDFSAMRSGASGQSQGSTGIREASLPIPVGGASSDRYESSGQADVGGGANLQ